jgi:hypothetical protein
MQLTVDETRLDCCEFREPEHRSYDHSFEASGYALGCLARNRLACNYSRHERWEVGSVESR